MELAVVIGPSGRSVEHLAVAPGVDGEGYEWAQGAQRPIRFVDSKFYPRLLKG